MSRTDAPHPPRRTTKFSSKCRPCPHAEAFLCPGVEIPSAPARAQHLSVFTCSCSLPCAHHTSLPFSCVSLVVPNRWLSPGPPLSPLPLVPSAVPILAAWPVTGRWVCVADPQHQRPVFTLTLLPEDCNWLLWNPVPATPTSAGLAGSNLGTSWHLNMVNHTEIFILRESYHLQLASRKLSLLVWTSGNPPTPAFAKGAPIPCPLLHPLESTCTTGFCFSLYFSRVLRKFGSHLRSFYNPPSLCFLGNILMPHFVLKYIHSHTVID